MKHSDKLDWMRQWCDRNNLVLMLEGECGLGRECVGVLSTKNQCYPDYEWYNEEYQRIDNNGDVWVPENAYHKHTCVAVLGRGKVAEAQLYDWLKWFEDNHFKYEIIDTGKRGVMDILMGNNYHARMVRCG